VSNKRKRVDVRVVLHDGTKSARSSADVFTFVVPTMSTTINGHWSAAQEQHVARSMVGRARRLNRAPIAHNPGHWTPAMGRSAVRRATAWLGLPYSWDGGTYSGPSYGACYGDGLITKFDCKFRGFDCSGLVLYGWGRYVHLDHFAATQRRQAGRFHPTVGELQPGDLLFFSGGGKQITHVVMYVGKGQVVEAAESGWPIRYTALADIMGWARYFGATRPVTARRLGTGPSVTALSQPTSAAAGGQTLTLHGARLDTTSRVAFGTTTIYDYTIKSAHTIVVKIPAHAPGKVHVRVWNAWGLSKASTANVFTYVDQ
jgi:cell wall-associated NlpC family hydrolase